MTLQVLGANNRAAFIPLKQNLVLNGRYFGDDQMLENHAIITMDAHFGWKIDAVQDSKIRVGVNEKSTISLIPGLIFHVGQTGFKVIARNLETTESWDSLAGQMIQFRVWKNRETRDFFFFLFPVQIRFLQGPQSGEIYTLSYGPRTLGFNQLDLNIKDPSQPGKILRFAQVGDAVVIENVSGQPSVLINKIPLTVHNLVDKDRISFGANVVEVDLLK